MIKKSVVLLTLSFFANQLLAQTATTDTNPAGATNEQNLNQTLLDNAATAKKYLEQSNGDKAPTSVKILSNDGSSSFGTSKTNNLTDQEKQLSENFVDQAGANRIIKEKCVGEMAQACAGSDVDHKVMGMNPVFIRGIAQAYAAFGAMGDILPVSAGSGSMFGSKDEKTGDKSGDKPKTEAGSEKKGSEANKDQAADQNKDQAKEKEKPTDYCKYIPAGTETIAMFAQKNTVQNLSNGGDTSQKELLLKAAKSHDGRAEQAQIQAVGWYGGAACYAVNAGLGNYAIDTNLVIKLAAATFLGTVYQGEVAANKKYAQKTRDIANSMPNKGACNPVTENECYCSTPEYENDQKFCKEQIAKKNAPTAFMKTACMDNMLKLDPSCNCEKNNSCFDKYLENMGATELQLGLGYGNSPFKPISSLAKGKLEGGTLNGNAYAGTSAIAKKALNDFMSKIPSNGLLNSGQKEMADIFASQGLPASASRLLAQASFPQSAISGGMDKARGFNGSGYQVASYGKNNVIDFSGGNGLGVGGNKMRKSGVDDLLGKIAGKGGSANNSKVLEFAQKAQANAPQITKSSDRFLFDIISNRYQTSGRRLLQIDPK
jgi:hypothetical protein